MSKQCLGASCLSLVRLLTSTKMLESKEDGLRTIRHRVSRLHPGQVAIVSLVSVLGIALLVHARQQAALDIRRYDTQAAAVRDSIDSLNSEIFKAWMVLSTY